MKFDPRAIRSFEQLGIKAPFDPRPIQLKMLASNFSGFNVLAKALPKTGKSTAVCLGLSKACKNIHSGLLIVPGLALASQYQAQFKQLGVRANVLSRTGDVQLDEDQHKALQTPSNILIATPARLLDYLAYDPKFPLTLKHLVVDELEMYQSVTSKAKTKQEQPLEILLERILKQEPQITLIQNSLQPLKFQRLQQILEQDRELVEVSEAHTPSGKVEVRNNRGRKMLPTHMFPKHIPEPKVRGTKGTKAYIMSLRKSWDRHGLVLAADRLSLEAIEQATGATAVKYNDLSGMNLDLQRLYICGWQSTFDIEKLASMVSDKVVICLANDDNKALDEIYRRG